MPRIGKARTVSLHVVLGAQYYPLKFMDSVVLDIQVLDRHAWIDRPHIRVLPHALNLRASPAGQLGQLSKLVSRDSCTGHLNVVQAGLALIGYELVVVQ